MALFLDSADLEDARIAGELGFVVGATTNPALMAKAGHTEPATALKALCEALPGPVFHQLTKRDVAGMRAEAKEFMGLASNLGLKIMCTLSGLQFAAEISGDVTVAITGVFAPAQAYLAAEAGASYVIPYVNRLTRYAGAGPSVIRDMADILFVSDTELLAAGIKTPAEAVETLLAGAEHVSLPLDVIQSMAENELTQQAFAAFDTYLSKG
ncbi:MAG: transaldolase family protein [Anaerolineales bacterium]|jgi:transaldolase